MAKKYYAVRVGKTPGIYLTWDDCKAMVDGYPGAKYKSFGSIVEAEAFLEGVHYVPEAEDKEDMSYAFVDGSYNIVTGVYGYGGFLIVGGEKHILQGSGDEEEMASMRNVAGEILGSMAAVKKALELGLKEFVVKKNREQAAKLRIEDLFAYYTAIFEAISALKCGEITPNGALKQVTARIFFGNL